MQIDEETFEAVSALTGDGLCLCEMIVDGAGQAVDYRFLKVNDRFAAYTGLEGAEGRTALELVPELEQHWIDTYARVGLGRESLKFENGSVPMGRWFEVCATPVAGQGRLAILFRDISQRRAAEEERQAALEQADRLFEELSHRVKNSLAIVSSIVSSEARAGPEALRPVLERVGTRVAAVGRLYDTISRTGAIAQVPVRPYLEAILEGLESSLAGEGRVAITSDLPEITLAGQQAVSLGLVVNELVTNSLKHAFPEGRSGRIAVRLRREGETCHLSIGDNGVGGEAEGEGERGLGSRLVAAFVANLGGEMKRECGAEGTCVRIRFPLEG